MRIVQDADCPECGWPETYAEGEERPERLGCSKCGWSEELDRA